MTDSNLWFPGANLSRLATEDGGSILGGEPKCVHHDTETDGLPGYETHFWPNITVLGSTPYQHIPANRASRALKNLSGGVQTNRWNAFQIEWVGWANKVTYRSIMSDIAQWLHEVRGTPLTDHGLAWWSYPKSAGATSIRMTFDEWNAFSGHCGHMHVPENVHGDPGFPFPIDQILSGQEAFWMANLTDAEQQEVLRAARQINDTAAPGTLNYEQTIEGTLAAVRTLINENRAQTGAFGRAITDAQAAVLGAVAALPTAHLDESGINALAERIAGQIPGISQDALLDALHTRLAA